MSAYEFYLRRSNSSWRPSFVKNMSNFQSTIQNYRKQYREANTKAAEGRVVANFSKAYGAWIAKVKNENAKRRAQETAFFKNLTAAKKSGNAAAVGAVMAKYNNGTASRRSPARQSSPARQRSTVARSASPKRSGKTRNTGNLRKDMARRNLSQMKANLMAQKAALESERNKLETQIFTLIRKIGELPNL